jgi:hypothetical protein
VCDDELPVSVRHCTFCNTNLETGHRGPLEAPSEDAIVAERKRGLPLVLAGSTGMAAAIGIGAIAPLPMLELVGFVVFTSAAGVLARGIHGVALSRRLAFKRRLALERSPLLGATGGASSSAAAPILHR